MNLWVVILIMMIIGVAISVITALCVREKNRKKLEYMLDAFEDNELNFRFKENSKFNKTLNRVKWIVEKRRGEFEQESWSKLIRVLTHEIMNTVSPIASLSEAMSHDIDKPDQKGDIDIKAGLKTISSSSRDLINFVESYRELAGVAKPVKKGLLVDNMVNKVIALTQEQCSISGVVCAYQASSEDILIYADDSQISRILINLIKNAIQAEAKSIMIDAHIDDLEQTIIRVSNDGTPISEEAQEQIFIPFFTTKREGSGIGLSLSRQIMRAHNGTINLTKSDAQSTVFTLLFK